MSFSQYWHQVPGWAKKVLGASLLIGATLVALGLLGDHHKVWEHWSFGANFCSSVWVSSSHLSPLVVMKFGPTGPRWGRRRPDAVGAGLAGWLNSGYGF
jgi:hypothetical protein